MARTNRAPPSKGPKPGLALRASILVALFFALPSLSPVAGFYLDCADPLQYPAVDAGPDIMLDHIGDVALHGSASDPDGGNVTVWWSATGSPSADVLNATSLNATLHPTKSGAYTVTLTVSDPTGCTQDDWLIVAVDNHPPAIVNFTPATSVVRAAENWVETRGDKGQTYHHVENGTASFDVQVADPDDGNVSVQWYLDNISSPYDQSAYQLFYNGSGRATYVVSARDGEHEVRVVVSDRFYKAEQRWTLIVADAGPEPRPLPAGAEVAAASLLVAAAACVLRRRQKAPPGPPAA